MNAARYVALNPVRARLVARRGLAAFERAAHLAGRDDGLVRVQPLIERTPHFADLISGEADAEAFLPLRRSELIGRPLGAAAFVAQTEGASGARSRRASAAASPITREPPGLHPAHPARDLSN